MSTFRRLLIANQKPSSGENLPQWFVDAVVCWYDIEKQGISNSDIHKGEPFVLTDFSGNNLNMTMYGFDATTASGITLVNGRAMLSFDGANDYGISKGHPVLTDYTICSSRILKDTDYWASKYTGGSGIGAFSIESTKKSRTVSFGQGTNVVLAKNFTYQSSDSYNGNTIVKGPNADTSVLRFGNNIGSSVYSKFDFGKFLLFNKMLKKEEIDWVINNILKA